MFHPEAINGLKNIHDGSTTGMKIPWEKSKEIKDEDTKYQDNTDYKYELNL